MSRRRTTAELQQIADQLAGTLETRVLATQMIQFCRDEEKWTLMHEEHLTTMLLKWQPGEQTKFHSHGDSIGVFRVLAGTVREEVLEDQDVIATEYACGETVGFEAGTIHRLTCTSKTPAISLHLYANAPGGLADITEYQTDPSGSLLFYEGKPVIARLRKMG